MYLNIVKYRKDTVKYNIKHKLCVCTHCGGLGEGCGGRHCLREKRHQKEWERKREREKREGERKEEQISK